MRCRHDKAQQNPHRWPLRYAGRDFTESKARVPQIKNCQQFCLPENKSWQLSIFNRKYNLKYIIFENKI